MTPHAQAPERGLIAELPATHAGLWTAITLTHDIAGQLSEPFDPESPERPSLIAEACRAAAESLAAARKEALDPSCTLPGPRVLQPGEGLPLVSALASDCIDLAVELLGNEEEPLTPAEVLGVTRAVTALCAVRSLAHGDAA